MIPITVTTMVPMIPITVTTKSTRFSTVSESTASTLASPSISTATTMVPMIPITVTTNSVETASAGVRWSNGDVYIIANNKSCLSQSFVIVNTFGSRDRRSDISGSVVTKYSTGGRYLASSVGRRNDGEVEVSPFF